VRRRINCSECPATPHVVVNCGRGLAQGRSNTAIAGRLGLTEKAITRHISCIYGELLLAPCREDHRRVLAVVRYLTR
jgi:DNA-binding NarL/FixJ family response regulator